MGKGEREERGRESELREETGEVETDTDWGEHRPAGHQGWEWAGQPGMLISAQQL